MKSHFRLLVSALFAATLILVTTGFAQAQDVNEPKGPAPKIVVENPVYDFGDIDPGSSQTGHFNFTNEGRGTLRISRIQSTCGCTVPELEKKTYEPGESGTITVKYRSGSRGGKDTKNLYILSNDEETPRAKLTIKANAIEKITYEPKRLILKLDKENAGAGEIKIESLDDRKFSITNVQVKPNCMKVNYDPAAEATEFIITPEVDINKAKTHKNGRIMFTLTHPSQKLISIPFSLVTPFKSDPSTLIALNASPSEPIRKTVYILSNYGEDFEVESVRGGSDAIKIVSEEKQSDKYVIVVDIIPPSDLGDKRHFTSELKVKIEGGEELTINCVGSIRKTD